MPPFMDFVRIMQNGRNVGSCHGFLLAAPSHPLQALIRAWRRGKLAIGGPGVTRPTLGRARQETHFEIRTFLEGDDDFVW
jgi:hypothetical protein